ncbi:type I-E CRISPR-associated protein Cse1/CasA [Thermoproteota archaeon]
MNLLTDPWIPVLLKSGLSKNICPWQVTENYERDPIIKVDTLRPDFDGALVQFFIGLFQTILAPEDDLFWKKLYYQPPSPQFIKDVCADYVYVFNLDSEGPRFMQDLEQFEGEKKSVHELLLNEPGEQTLRENKDVFIKRKEEWHMSLQNAVLALFTLQINAPSGGKGHRTSLRGGGPLTTLVVPDPSFNKNVTLWQIIWLNVLSSSTLNVHFPLEKTDMKNIFPWLAQTRTSETDIKTTYNDVHPLQQFWPMPRRIRFCFDDQINDISMLSANKEKDFKEYITKNYGINYESTTFRHPLSPYRKTKNEIYFPVHPEEKGLAYKNWLEFVYSANSSNIEPAKVVYRATKGNSVLKNIKTRLWIFGYDMDNMKARSWQEAHFPIYYLKEEGFSVYIDAIQGHLELAREAAFYLRTAIAKAWFSPKLRKTIQFIEKSFWMCTESDFFKQAGSLHSLIENNSAFDSEEVVKLKVKWFDYIKNNVMSLFNTWVMSSNILYEDSNRIVQAKHYLKLCFVKAKKKFIPQESNAK